LSLSLCELPGLSAGIKKTSSPWRSQIFEAVPQSESIRIPFSPDAMLSLVHVEDVARMLFTLVKATEVNSFVYNTPAEIWEVKELKGLVENLRGIRVELGPEGAWADQCATAAASRENLIFIFETSVTIFQAALEPDRT